ncbi:uncharacterized protein V1516DRAFT_668087 [Lipomyces oligophaga]|uniref:uncharacterized protein n=1 Tax=Lipomyces oligophaga TaxID=45792 RepID=UPI0034CDF62F
MEAGNESINDPHMQQEPEQGHELEQQDSSALSTTSWTPSVRIPSSSSSRDYIESFDSPQYRHDEVDIPEQQSVSSDVAQMRNTAANSQLPLLFRTRTMAASRRIRSGLPSGPLPYIQRIRERMNMRNLSTQENSSPSYGGSLSIGSRSPGTENAASAIGSSTFGMNDDRALSESSEAAQSEHQDYMYERNGSDDRHARDTSGINGNFVSLLRFPLPGSHLRRVNTIRRRESTYREPSTTKRRRREDGVPDELWNEIPTQLQMKLIFCDGGWHGDNYLPQNVLVRNTAVYCAQKSKCNMILRHNSGQAFSVHSIRIEAPTTGYTCPVRRGLIYVSMDKDQLIPQSEAQEKIIDSLPLSEGISSLVDYDSTRDIRLRNTETLMRMWDSTATDAGSVRREAWYSPSGPLEEGMSSTTSFVDGTSLETEIGEGTSLQLLSDYRASNSRSRFRDRHGINGRVSHLRHTEEPRIINTENLRILRAEGDGRVVEGTRPPTGESFRPVAKFKIPDNKSLCTITFESPLTAKYVCIKFFSSYPEQNLDVQGVYVYGFYGPQSFPSMNLR